MQETLSNSLGFAGQSRAKVSVYGMHLQPQLAADILARPMSERESDKGRQHQRASVVGFLASIGLADMPWESGCAPNEWV